MQTPELMVLNQGQILASTAGEGQGGSLTIDAPDRVLLSDSRLSVATSGNARAGDLAIATNNLTFNGGQILASSTGTGAAGNLSITADDVMLSDRARVTAETRSSRGGNIQFSVQDTLQLQTNSAISASTRTGTGGSLNVSADSVQLSNNSELAVAAQRTGSAGDLNVTATDLTVNDSSVTVSNPQGQAGTLSIQADQIRLLDGAQLIAEAGGTGRATNIAQAEIQLREVDLLLLRNHSLISARANGSTDGGNISIDAEDGFVIAVPQENSDIIAIAEQGNGGRIDIAAQQIIGFQKSEERSPLSEINASSEFGSAGTILLNTPIVDLSRGLTELPADVTDASTLIATGCSPTATAQANQGEFYRTGRGGIAPSPTDVLGSSDVLEDLQPPASWATSTEPSSQVPQVVEAQGWQTNDRGEVELVASTQQRPCER
ncbi:S-layer family protein [Leptolyngbya sp. FACHB-671]|uniref:S-layer family protein n=1 Tax=Leptolyngbya sp. FACHB-671 TaxID=2692812 RepID=UPI001685320C|nr:S-layer family protein [Leptolyngbya sp. FACHB-671]MBD2068939.1 S-layer family protein [Leptolyngbya sp. FACHB-671]